MRNFDKRFFFRQRSNWKKPNPQVQVCARKHQGGKLKGHYLDQKQPQVTVWSHPTHAAAPQSSVCKHKNTIVDENFSQISLHLWDRSLQSSTSRGRLFTANQVEHIRKKTVCVVKHKGGSVMVGATFFFFFWEEQWTKTQKRLSSRIQS